MSGLPPLPAPPSLTAEAVSVQPGNVLEAARLVGCSQVVHIGSCHSVWPSAPHTGHSEPGEIFMDVDARRPDGGLYAVQKRLQEEMCRQFHDAHGLPVTVFRPDYIIDTRLGLGRHREDLRGQEPSKGWVCRHEIALACRLAVEKTVGFEILHVVNNTAGQAGLCNVGRTESLLGMRFDSAVARL